MNLATSFYLLFSLSFAQAQQQTPIPELKYPKRIISRYEFMIGPNYISVTGSDHLKQHRISNWGFRGGVGLIHTFNSLWELDAKISYENKGYRIQSYSENPGPPASDKLVEDLSLNYITLTLLLRYSVIPDQRLALGIGPYAGWLTTVRVDQRLYFQDALVSKFQRRFDPPWFYRELDLGASFVITSNFMANKRRGIIVQFVYSIGLRDVPEPSAGNFRNNTFSLLLGISLQKK